MKKGNNGGGGTAPKSGDMRVPTCRKAGFNKTMTAMGSSTRSAYKGGEMNNLWKGCVTHETGAQDHRGWNPE